MQDTGATAPLSAELSTHLTAVTGQAGEPLGLDVRAPMEHRLGVDLSSIRVHAGGNAAEVTSALGASALSVGDHIVFGQGQFRPSSGSGQRLLAHEIAHTFQPNSDVVVRRSTNKPDDLPAMGELINLIWSDKPKEVTSVKLALLVNERLMTIRESAMLRRAGHQNDLDQNVAGGESNDFSREFLAEPLRLLDALIARIDAILTLRGAVLESREFGTNAKNVRDAIVSETNTPLFERITSARTLMDGEALGFFDIALPRIPKFLKGLLTGREVSPSASDRAYAGYLDVATVQSFANNKDYANSANVLASMTVAPLNLARSFFLAGDDVGKMKTSVAQEFKHFDAGIDIMETLEEKLGSGVGDTNIERLTVLMEEFQEEPGTLYSCKPGMSVGGDAAQSDSSTVHKILDERATQWLTDEQNKKPLAESWEVETRGLLPED